MATPSRAQCSLLAAGDNMPAFRVKTHRCNRSRMCRQAGEHASLGQIPQANFPSAVIGEDHYQLAGVWAASVSVLFPFFVSFFPWRIGSYGCPGGVL